MKRPVAEIRCAADIEAEPRPTTAQRQASYAEEMAAMRERIASGPSRMLLALQEACAGIELSADELRLLAWLARGETWTVETVCGLVLKLRGRR